MILNSIFILLTFFDGVGVLSKISKENNLKKESEAAYYNKDFKTASEKLNTLRGISTESNEKINLNLAHSYYNQNDLSNAAKNYEQLLSAKDNQIKSVAAQQLGIISLKGDKDKEKALAFFKEAIRANPNNTEARKNYELLKNAKEKKEDPKIENKDKNQNKDEKKEQEKKEDKKDDKNQQNKQNQDNQNQKGGKDQKDDKNQQKGEDKNKNGEGKDKKEGKGENGDKQDQNKQDPNKGDNQKNQDQKGKDKGGKDDKNTADKQPKDDQQGKNGEKKDDKSEAENKKNGGGKNDEKNINKDGKNDQQKGEQAQNGQALKNDKNGKEKKDKFIVNPEALAKIGMNEQRARTLLNAMKSSEVQYLQQVKRTNENQKNKKGKPDW
jgi:Ca-activated chloride channel homolog